MAQMRLVQGELALAGEWFEEGLVFVREAGDREGAIEALLDLGRVAVAQGDLTLARRRYQEGLTILQEIGSQKFLAACLEGLAALEAEQGAPRHAARLIDRPGSCHISEDSRRSIGDEHAQLAPTDRPD